jgi:hypothetical protein
MCIGYDVLDKQEGLTESDSGLDAILQYSTTSYTPVCSLTSIARTDIATKAALDQDAGRDQISETRR